MAVLDQIGTTLETAAQATLAGYIVAGQDTIDKNVDMEDIDDESGALKTRILYKRQPKVVLDLIVVTGAYTTDFPVGAIAGATGWTTYFVESAVASKSRSATRVKVTLVDLGITA